MATGTLATMGQRVGLHGTAGAKPNRDPLPP
jgi:hypothetical protein